MNFFSYKGKQYPEYLRNGNASSYILPFAQKWCVGRGLDVGAGRYPFPGAVACDPNRGADRSRDARNLPPGPWDYIYSSHCLEHLPEPQAALAYWHSLLRSGGILFLYLPHPDNEEWLPENTKGHVNIWLPEQVGDMVRAAGFPDIFFTGMDLLWSFAIVGIK